ncbi:MAG: Rab family GTPase [Candidatus Kariarchaeaceae archaeon]
MVVNKFLTKVVLCGAFGVGKTSLRNNFMGLGFTSQHIQTLGVDFAHKSVEITENIIINLQIWDFGGQPGYKTFRKRYLHGVEAALLVYDLTQADSFIELSGWIEEIWTDEVNMNIPIILLGNKSDLEGWNVTEDQVSEFVNELKEKNKECKFIKTFLTSAKTGDNVNEAFTLVAQQLFETKFKDKVI